MEKKPPEQSLVNTPLPEEKNLSVFDKPSLADGLGALARTTDAIVDRVARERDPAEHVLDQLIRAQSEEYGDRMIRIQCDRCGIQSPGAVNEAIAGLRASDAGWLVTDAADHCPSCRDDSKALPEGVVSLDFVRSSKLGGLDAILRNRIEFLHRRHLDGMSAAACVYNAHSSGHRHMLTDLCRQFQYDPERLFDRIPELGLGLLLDEAARDWVKRLFKIVQAEDAGDTG